MKLALLLVLGLHAQDPVQVRATLADPEVREGETTVLRVDVETDGPRAQIQRFTRLPPGLELVSTRDFDQRQFSMPGGTRRFVSREFVLRARAAGQYRIPSLDVVVEGRPYTTESRLLTVMAAPARPRGEARVSEDGVMLHAWLDADTAFVGEQVTLQVEAMFSQDARLRLRRAPEYEPPSPSGFWINDLPDRRSPGSRMVGNEIYEVQSFRRAFFPLTAGEYEIPPARLEYEMRRGLLYAPETHEIRSDVLPLVVLPLPEADQPPEFTGAVGEYTMRAWLEPASVPAGEATVLTVEVEGTGNVKAIPPPALPELDEVEVYPPSEDATTEADGGDIRGTKRFTWVMIPRDAGDLEIPPVRYAYFNPGIGGYETVETAPLDLHVTPGVAGAESTPSAPNTVRFVKLEPGGADPLAWVRSPWFALAQVVPLFGLAALVGYRRLRFRGSAVSLRALRRERRATLRHLERRAEAGDRTVLGEAESFGRGWLAERLGVAPRRADHTDLVALGVTERTAISVLGLLDRLAAARYAPSPPAPQAVRDLIRALGRTLERVDRESAAPRRTSPGAGPAPASSRAGGYVLATVLAGAAAAGVPAVAVAQAPSAFDEGVSAFEAGRFEAAARAFDRYVGQRPRDPAGWYNLGTAYHRAGHHGYAVWAWLHVPRLDPRDADTRHNLGVAGVPPELVARVAPPVPLRPEELLALASLAWFIALFGAWWWIARGRSTGGVVAGFALLLALAAVGGWWDSTRDHRTLIVLDDTTLRAGPTIQGEPLAEIAPGTGLVAVDGYGDWVRARTADGVEGWIEAGTTGRI